MNAQVIELAGPAGAGKSTLASHLARSPEITVGIPLRRIDMVHGVTASAGMLARARLDQRGRWWRRSELRSIAYLHAWRAALPTASCTTSCLVLDHGPVFRLAALLADGPRMTRSAAFQRWWLQTGHRWAEHLDAVVWLDTDDDELQRRIDGRQQDHQLRGASATVTASFLDRYRDAFARVLTVVQDRGVQVLRVDSGAHTPADLQLLVHDAVLARSTRNRR